MTSPKRQIINTIERMDEDSAIAVWDLLRRYFSTPDKELTWDDIEEAEPDAIDLEMLAEMERNPDCNEYITSTELETRRNARTI